MTNELMHSDSAGSVPRRGRAALRQMKATHNDVRLAGLKIDGAIALGAHIMDGIAALDAHRHDVANGDPAMLMLLADIESATLRQVKGVQASLLDRWGL